ncbi:anti-sigma factor [Nonlabens antarcticus]|uniref:anti-sigma factor n=1 Tax=Nonlabens antarcticus TaxID=392714 RepID=UPI001891E0D0|nr:anti-sigma factor [Nonlabens antarcticus]
MDIQDTKNSGDLEAYVCGALTRQENMAIAKLVRENPELEEEVEAIERAYFKLAAGIAPAADEIAIYESIKGYIREGKAKSEDNHWSQYLGWAAAIVLLFGTSYMFYQNTELNDEMISIVQKNQILNVEVESLDSLNLDYKEALAFIKKPNTLKINLAGQGDHGTANAVVFHNKEQNITYLDITGLPDAPANMTYQLWSLTLNPLTPTNLGIVAVDNKNLIEFTNPNDTEAFGITLEEAGGSPTPTLERLYTLGAIE